MTSYGSVCSGVEAATVAWAPFGWRAAWFAEIDKFPSRVLAHHYPDVPNLGDMTGVATLVRSGAVAAPDVLVGGTPCQAFSFAGLRQSLDDARGQLTLSFVDLANAIDAMRTVPSIIVWENVPGVLSTKDNAFGCFLGALAGEDDPLLPPGKKNGGFERWPNAGCVYGPRRTIAWRTLDAQYVGVAQRRRRVFVVASARDGFDPAAVLFEFDGVRRDTAPRRESRQEITGTLGARASSGGGFGTDFECAAGIQPVACGVTGDVAHTLRAEGFDASEDGTGRDTPIICMAHGQGGAEISVGQRPTLTCNHEAPIIAFSAKDHGADASADLAPTMRAMGHSGSHANGGGQLAVATHHAVRRLTPRECERLQAFPDDYTAIPGAADGPRYKALGNSMCVNVIAWLGRRLLLTLPSIPSTLNEQ